MTDLIIFLNPDRSYLPDGWDDLITHNYRVVKAKNETDRVIFINDKIFVREQNEESPDERTFYEAINNFTTEITREEGLFSQRTLLIQHASSQKTSKKELDPWKVQETLVKNLQAPGSSCEQVSEYSRGSGCVWKDVKKLAEAARDAKKMNERREKVKNLVDKLSIPQNEITVELIQELIQELNCISKVQDNSERDDLKKEFKNFKLNEDIPEKFLKAVLQKHENILEKFLMEREAPEDLASALLIKYDAQFKFRLLDQITAELILKSFGQNANADAETGEFLDPKEHPIWNSWPDELRGAYENVQPTQNTPEFLVDFLEIANAEAVQYLKEINPQQATSE